MDYKNFEGFKKIKNTKNLTVEEIYEILKGYQENAGEVKYAPHNEDLKIVVDVTGKYYVDIYLSEENIVIERKLEEGHTEDDSSDGKSIALAHADRMIDQIYDLLKEYISKGKITEHITKAKEVIYVSQGEFKRALLGALVLPKYIFEVKDESGKKIYEVKLKTLSSSFSLFNLESKREEAVLNYSKGDDKNSSIIKYPFENIVIKKETNTEKTTYTANISTKKLKVTADYTDNHYILEVNEVFIGSIDSIVPETKKEYRLEINDLEYKYLVILFTILLDLKEYDKLK